MGKISTSKRVQCLKDWQLETIKPVIKTPTKEKTEEYYQNNKKYIK